MSKKSTSADESILSTDGPGRSGSDEPVAHGTMGPVGDRNRNPRGMKLWKLIAEDFQTHGRHLLEPGFMALAAHRLANARWDVKNATIRLPLTVVCRVAATFVNWTWGIEIPYHTKIGRRVRIWHHGGMVLGARAIGDDVQIRHNTTFGQLSRRDPAGIPIIGNRVDVGVGASILGPTTVGDDSVIAANSLVIRHVPPGATVMGVPARQAALIKNEPPAGDHDPHEPEHHT